ncbi:MAG: hypothetical protein H6912_11205 [Kordiimonadaceae bacterium]|nr:hypothetical protein [Kordiimonadaceae bacterium]
MKIIFATFLQSLIFFQTALAEQVEFGISDKSISELSQFEYLKGEWDVTIQTRQENGQFNSLENKAKVKGFYLQDGRSFQTIFSTTNGGFTTDIRSYDKEEHKWKILFMNARAQRWHQFEAHMENEEMITFVPGGYSGKEDFDVRIIDKDFSDKKFTKEVFRKLHNKDDWQKIYIMNFERIR